MFGITVDDQLCFSLRKGRKPMKIKSGIDIPSLTDVGWINGSKEKETKVKFTWVLLHGVVHCDYNLFQLKCAPYGEYFPRSHV